MSKELQEIKDEIASLGTRMDNVEGYFNNFDITLTNHMTDYALKQTKIDGKLKSLYSRFTWGFWVIFSLLTLVLGAFITGTVMLLQQYFRLLGGN